MNPPSFLTDSDELLSYLQDFASVSVPDPQIVATVSEILADLKQNGDKALLERTMLYDEVSLSPEDISVAASDLEKAESSLSSEERSSIEEAIENVRFFHEKSIPSDWAARNDHVGEVG